MKFLRQLRALFHRDRLDAEMSEEMRTHLDSQAAENEKRGMAPDEAWYAARRAFGGEEQIKERARDRRGFVWLEQWARDVQYGVRQLRKNPGFTVVAVLSLALGIGANTAIFGLVDEVLLKSLPVRNPEELVLIRKHGRICANAPHWIQGEGGFSPVVVAQLREHSAPMAELFAFAPLRQLNVLVDGQPEMVAWGQIVTGNYHAILGVAPRLGRMLTPLDDRPEAEPVAVISYRYWRNRFDHDPAVLGKTVWLNGVATTIVGVTPANFSGTLPVGEAPDFSVPLALAPRLKPDAQRRYDLNQPSYWWLQIMGRLSATATREQLLARLDPVFQQAVFEAYPETRGKAEPPGLNVDSGAQGLDGARRAYRKSLLFLTGIVALVLLIAVVNLANLLLSRAVARRREIALRLALGASRSRIVRQLLTESLLLALLGAGGGVLFAWWGTDLLLALHPAGGGGLALDLPADGRVLGFTAAVAVATGILFGLVPALQATRMDLKTEFQGGAGSAGGSRSWLGRSLMVSQVALSFILLIGAGLFVRTLRQLQRTDAGFNVEHLLLFRLDAATAGRDRDAAAALYEQVRERIRDLPGVHATSFSFHPLLSSTSSNGGGGILDYEHVPGEKSIGGDINGVGPEFFRTVEIPLLLGRDFGRADTARTAEVVVLNQALAREVFGAENPLGRRTSLGNVIGVVADARYDELRRTPAPTAYVPFQQVGWLGGQGNFVVRTDGDPRAVLAAIREAMRQIDPKLPIYDVRTQREQIGLLLGQERLFAQLSGFFGGLAALLVCVGLYGLMSFAVFQRTREIGIRMALGAMPRGVMGMIVREALGLVGLGIVAGTIGALATGRLVRSLLYGLSPTDLPTYSAMAFLLVAVAAAAALIPARRATKIDPMLALRAE